jgi:hypothetical protein
MLDGGFDDSLSDPVPPKPTHNKETGDGPDSFVRGVIINEPTICRSWSNRTPSDRFIANVSEQPDGNTGRNPLGHRSLTAGSVCTLCFLRSSTPHHTPTGLGTTSAFKKPLEVRPAALIHFMEYKMVEFR